MDPAYVSAFAALAGSAIGGLTSLTASWLTQRVQVGAQQLAHDVSVREALYKDFIDEASRAFVHAIQNSEADVATIVRLYALVNRMRIMSSQPVVHQADVVMRLIIDTYRAPNTTLLAAAADRLEHSDLDPLRAFGEACRDEFRQHLDRAARRR